MFCAHEYTQSNARFAMHVDGGNAGEWAEGAAGLVRLMCRLMWHDAAQACLCTNACSCGRSLWLQQWQELVVAQNNRQLQEASSCAGRSSP